MRQLNQYICQYCNNTKILQTCYFGYFGHDQPCPPKLIIPTCRKVWCLSACQKSTSPPLLSWDIAMILQTCYFGYFGHAWLWPPKMLISTCRKIWCLSSCEKSNTSLTSFLKYCWDIANLLFWALWACLATPIKHFSTDLQQSFMFTWMQKIHFISPFFLEILLRYCKLVVLNTLDMPGYAHQSQ